MSFEKKEIKTAAVSEKRSVLSQIYPLFRELLVTREVTRSQVAAEIDITFGFCDLLVQPKVQYNIGQFR